MFTRSGILMMLALAASPAPSSTETLHGGTAVTVKLEMAEATKLGPTLARWQMVSSKSRSRPSAGPLAPQSLLAKVELTTTCDLGVAQSGDILRHNLRGAATSRPRDDAGIVPDQTCW
jgi:hypothetical protein